MVPNSRLEGTADKVLYGFQEAMRGLHSALKMFPL